MRIEVLNPNSSEEVTALIAGAAAALENGADITCTTLHDAPIGIESDADVARVAPMVVARAAGTSAAGLVVACFSDPGVATARPRASIPVIGIAEAAYREAAGRADRFGVVSLGPASVARHAAHLSALGLRDRLAGDRAVGMTVADGHAPGALDRITPVARALIDRDGAGAVILGCAGMAALRGPLQDRLGVPVIEPVQAGIRAAVAALREGRA